MSNTKDRKIMDEVHEVMRLHQSSIHTERSQCDWIKRFIRFHKMESRDVLKGGELKIEQFLTHLAVNDEELRPFILNHQHIAQVAMFTASAEAIKKLTPDEKFIGGDIPGFFGMLHTRGRQLTYHPHIH